MQIVDLPLSSYIQGYSYCLMLSLALPDPVIYVNLIFYPTYSISYVEVIQVSTLLHGVHSTQSLVIMLPSQIISEINK